MRLLLLFLTIAFIPRPLTAKILHTGHGQPFPDVTAAAKAATPGDTIFIHAGTYPGNQILGNLQGTAKAWIYIIAEKQGSVWFEGGTSAWRGTDVAYLHIEGMGFAKQTGNGVNFDDGSTYNSPAHHIVFRHCIFKDMAASGNNDLLKLSGVDEVTIQHCTFINGAKGGSGIDMVGCHKGLISQCHFENLGANAVQMKGGSNHIKVERSVFIHAGSRAINLGGSTGEAFFRPANATWEAADLIVDNNYFSGSDVPVAFVGCIRSSVINNTICHPERWVIRILQENKDTLRFAKCADNTFSNNKICINSQVRTVCSIGPGTAPESFTFSGNQWTHNSDSTWQGPQLPVSESGGTVSYNPACRNCSIPVALK